MLLRLISVLLVSLLSLLPAQLDAYITRSSTGCFHNGTWYGDKSIVPTMEKCLNCQCNKKSLVCRLKVCPEMPMPPPRGCVVVQKKNICCPYLSCARLEAFYKIPMTRRIIAYLDHYERESIDRVVNDNMLQRRSDDSEVDLQVCVKNGTVYKSGSAMSSSNLCTYCYCIGGAEKCVKPKCMLPVEGCKPIFVDSTCCPVRYDCSSKTSGKSSQEVRYRKTANKHFLRMSQRLQRNRGCTVGESFYVEGQKMKSDVDKPCDICFCIRGTRRCAPKKCSPALKNCIPVVPKGQCCPSSYDCGSQRDYRRAQSSRQFNLFSLLFGKDENSQKGDVNAEQYPHDRHPEVTDIKLNKNPKNTLISSSEKSLFDTIKEGLEFIDTNNNQMLTDNEDLAGMQATADPPIIESVTTSPTIANNEGLSFLDILLGPSNGLKNNPESTESLEEISSEETPTTFSPTLSTSLSWVDILLGPDEEEEKNENKPSSLRDELLESSSQTVETFSSESPNIDRVSDDFDDDSLGSYEISVGELPAEDQDLIKSSTYANLHQTTDNKYKDGTTLQWQTTLSATDDKVEASTTKTSTIKPFSADSKLSKGTNLTKQPLHVSTSTTSLPITSGAPKFVKKITTSSSTTTVMPSQAKTTFSTTKPKLPSTSTTSSPKKATAAPKPANKTISSTSKPKEQTQPTIITTTKKPQNPVETPQKVDKKDSIAIKDTKPDPNRKNPTNPQKKNDLLAAFLDGLSGILSIDRNSNETLGSKQNKTKESSLPLSPQSQPSPIPIPLPLLDVSGQVTKSPPHFKPLPSSKPFGRINSKIANLTVQPPMITTKNIQNSTSNPVGGATSKISGTTTKKPQTTTRPVKPKETSTQKPMEHYVTTTTQNPVVIKTNPTILEVDPIEVEATLPPSLPNLKIIPFLPTDAVKQPERPHKPVPDYYNPHGQISRIDYGLYDEPNVYPSITESFPYYPDLDDDNKAEYIYKFNVEVPPAVDVKFEGSVPAPAIVKYDFVPEEPQKNGFSPPTKTEGGFVPKEPLVIDDEIVTPDNLEKMKIEDNYYATHHIIDITTGHPLEANVSQVIEITTPDPFKDVIRTEPPPDLFSLIEDKEKITDVKFNSKIESMLPNRSRDESVPAKPRPFMKEEELIISPQVELNSSLPHKIISIPPPNLNKKKNTLESFLDFFLADEEPLYPLDKQYDTSSVIPPFKSLPNVKDASTTTASNIIVGSTDKPLKENETTTPKDSTTTTTATEAEQNTDKTLNSTTILPIKKTSTSSSVTSYSVSTTSSTSVKVSNNPIKSNKTKSNATIVAHNNSPVRSKVKPKPANRNTVKVQNTTLSPKATKRPKPSNRRNSTKIVTTLPTVKTTSTTSTPTTKLPFRTTTTHYLHRSNLQTTTSTPFNGILIQSSTPTPTVAPTSTTTVPHPFLNSPFDKLPFMDTSYEIKQKPYHTHHHLATVAPSTTATPNTNKLLGLVNIKNSLNQLEGLEPLQNDNGFYFNQGAAQSSFEQATHLTTVSTKPQEVQQGQAVPNNLIDPSGLLKLAGCNIYGRMYRVGRIILELSSPCLECRCTEVGVKCNPLDC